MTAVLERIKPYLPAGVAVEMTHHAKWLTLQRFADGDVRIGSFTFTPGSDGKSMDGEGKTVISGLGSWIPFMPKRLAAQDAVETVLGVAYQMPGQSPSEVDCDVRAEDDGDVVRVSYVPPGGADPDDRVHLEPIPLALL